MSGNKPWFWPDTQGFLAVAIISLMGAIIFILLFHPMKLDETINGVLMTVIGVLAGELKNVYGYYFGSSSSSRVKDATIATAVTAIAPAAAAEEHLTAH